MPTLTRTFLIVVSFLLMIFIYLIIQGLSNYQGFRDYHQTLAQRSVNATASEISILINSYRRMVKLFVNHHQSELAAFIAAPQNTELSNRLADSLSQLLPENADFAITDGRGNPLFTYNSADLGNDCRLELVNFARNRLNPQPVKIHTDEHGSHFDIVVDLSRPGGEGMFFVSFNLERLKAILRNGEVNGHRMLLLRRDMPHTSAMAQDEAIKILSRAFPVEQPFDRSIPKSKTSDTQYQILASTPIDGTSWLLADLPAPSLFLQAKQEIALETLIIFVCFTGISLFMLFLSKREAKRSGETALAIEGIEAERKRIAMDLHDQVLGEITHAVRETGDYLDSCSDKPDIQARIIQLKDSLSIIADGIRVVIDDLHPQALNILGLEAAFRTLLEKHHTNSEMPDWSLSVEPGIDRRLSKGRRLHLYRILLEVTQNIFKHAHAKRFDIAIRRTSHNRLQIIVEDDGIGFNPKIAGAANSLGIANVQTRTRMIGGQVEWSSCAAGKGTRFELNMDLKS